MSQVKTFDELYSAMLAHYGNQGWWPLMDVKLGESSYSGKEALSPIEEFEIAAGAILTQNVSWKNVDKCLLALKRQGMMNPKKLHKAEHGEIAVLIRSAGYYNQKTRKLKNFLDWFKSEKYSFAGMKKTDDETARRKLLDINGIGPETADSILLYAVQKKTFVVDAYTKRQLARMGFIEDGYSYEELRSLFHKKFTGNLKDYKEFHALFVRHGKNFCSKKPLCGACFLSNSCSMRFSS